VRAVTEAMPTLIAGRYRVLRELGRGGMGAVYLAEHVHTGDHVALKVLHGHAGTKPETLDRFKREARASGKIRSEHVVKVIDADAAPELGGAPFLVMELLDGADLERLLKQRGRFSFEEVVTLLGQAARALDKSHEAGIVHRDLKPENLFHHRREDGSWILKIVDFGISKVIQGESGADMASAGLTSTGAIMGTPLYMSPEQARGRISSIGPATDIWAIGLITIRLLTGELYWTATTVAELMVQLLSEPLYPPTSRWPWLPSGIDAWFARSCSRDLGARWTSVGEQIEALRTALATKEAPQLAPAPATPAASGPFVTTGGPSAMASGGATPAGYPSGSFAAAQSGSTTTSGTSQTGAGLIAAPAPKRRTWLVIPAMVVALLAGGAVALFLFNRIGSPTEPAAPPPPASSLLAAPNPPPSSEASEPAGMDAGAPPTPPLSAPLPPTAPPSFRPVQKPPGSSRPPPSAKPEPYSPSAL
jgi:eukaryotic-like serine/threonine-protein kinase